MSHHPGNNSLSWLHDHCNIHFKLWRIHWTLQYENHLECEFIKGAVQCAFTKFCCSMLSLIECGLQSVWRSQETKWFYLNLFQRDISSQYICLIWCEHRVLTCKVDRPHLGFVLVKGSWLPTFCMFIILQRDATCTLCMFELTEFCWVGFKPFMRLSKNPCYPAYDLMNCARMKALKSSITFWLTHLVSIMSWQSVPSSFKLTPLPITFLYPLRYR